MRRRKLTPQEILDPYFVRGNGEYKLDMPDRAYGLALLGLTDREIAMAFGVTTIVFNGWKDTKAGFAEMLEKGKVLADAEVAKSLFKCALGYSFLHPYTTIWQKTGEVKTVYQTMQAHPNPYAAAKWLQMRQRERWNVANKIEADLNVVVKKEDLDNFSDQELEAIEKLGLKQLTQNIQEN